MARKSFKEEVAKKSPWLNAKKKAEKVPKSQFPEVEFLATCRNTHDGDSNTPLAFVARANAQIVRDYPRDKVWAIVECPKCHGAVSGYFYVESATTDEN